MNINIFEVSDLKSLQNLPLDFIHQKDRFYNMFSDVPFPITLVVENFYNDRDYKDSYYYFFASKYNNYSKYCYRVAILEGSLSEKQLYDNSFTLDDKLIGTITIKPLKVGTIGKTFFNPTKLKMKTPSYLRTTKFEVGILGRRLLIESFPFSSQDSEYMTCAETTLWSMLQYYGTRYKEYKVALPHEIVNVVDDKYFQRVSPSSGLHYMQSSEVLKKFGFSSQVYYRFIGNKNYYAPDNQFKRLFHYYVESGIPLMVGIQLKSSLNIESGHAVVCVGHGVVNVNASSEMDNINGVNVLNSADFINEYVYMDDNKYPFYNNRFDEFEYDKTTTKIKYFIVPLYKRVFLDAFEAEKTFNEVMRNDIFGLNNFRKIDEPVVIRIFLTTSRNYKESRFHTLTKSYQLLDNIPLPKFIWVCEISTKTQYSNSKISAEIVLDATASKNDKFDQLILLRYPKKFSFKLFNENIAQLKNRLKNRSGLENVYDMYKNNLKEIN